MNRPPVIGINANAFHAKTNSYYRLDRLYVDAIRKAGGVPVILPFDTDLSQVKNCIDRLDGLLLTGGADIHPRRWGERRVHPKTQLLDPDKEAWDFRLVEDALRRDLPTLAICYGFQLVNVALGGTLHQHVPDLPDILAAHQKSGTRHSVEFASDFKTRDIVRRRSAEVNSYHHQGIHRLASELCVTARSSDGLIEGAERPKNRFLVGVQWHPERLLDRNDQVNLFKALVSEARKS